MDELRRLAAPLVELWQRLGRGQRFAAIAVLVAGAVGLAFLWSDSAERWQPISGGREFSTSEFANIQNAWRQRGLKSFRRDGRKLLVLSDDHTRYEAALPKSNSADADSGDEWDKQFARTNLFTTPEQFEQIKDNRLRNELRRVLKAIPAIADADVIWARSKSRAVFTGRSKVTATINVTPRDGHDLTPELAQSLRTAVARMVPDLSQEDIAVLDQSTGLAITDDSDELIAEQHRHRQQERLARQLETKIAATLAHIPGATVEARWKVIAAADNVHHVTAKPVLDAVAVNWTSDLPDNFVEFSPSLFSRVPETTTEPVRSSAWHIAVQIPQAYFATHADECARLRDIVHHLLPTDTSIAAFSIVPGIATSTTTVEAAGITFAAWPHVAGVFLAFLSIVAVMRKPARRRAETVSPPIRECLSDSAACPPVNEIAEPDVAATISKNVANVSDIARLQQIDPQQLAEALRQERPQAIAVLLTRFPTRLASACLSRLTSSLQTDVIRRLKSLGEVPEELVAEIAQTVCQRLSLASETPVSEPTNRIGHLLPESPSKRVFA